MTLGNQNFTIPDNYTEFTPTKFRAMVLEASNNDVDLNTIKQVAITYIHANEDLILPEYRS